MTNLGDYSDVYWRSSDGLRLYARDYESTGSGKLPIICLPGLTRSSRDYKAIAEQISARGRRVICVDLRGRGESERDTNADNYRIPVYVADIRRLLDKLNVAHAIFFGTSLGGRVTMSFAAHHPGIIRGAIINDIGVQVEDVGLDRITQYMAALPSVTTWEEAQNYCRKYFAPARAPSFSNWADLVSGTFRARPDGSPEFNYDRRIAPGPGTTDMGPFTSEETFEVLGRSGPILVLRGARSDILSVAEAERMKELADDLIWVEIPGVAHAPNLDEPESLDAVTRFLDRAP